MQHHIVREAAGIGILSWERGRPARSGPQAHGLSMRAGRPCPGGTRRSQDVSFPDDPAPTASPFGPGATAWCG